jgi:ankyrin repeat protein
MAIAPACRSRRPSIYCSEDEEEIMNIIVDNTAKAATSENNTTAHHQRRKSSPSQHSQSMILPPKVSLIDNTLALGFSLKRARGEMGGETMVLKKSNSDSVIHTKRRKVDHSYNNHNHVVINSTNHLTSSSSFSKVDDNTNDPEENLCPYSFIDSLLQSSRRNSMSSSPSSSPLCKEEGSSTTKPLLDDNDFHPPTPEQIEAYSNDAVNAVRSSDVDCLRTLLSNGQSLQCCNRFGESLLHVACRRSNAEVVSFLLHEAKVSPCIRDDYGRTPLHDACWRGNPEYEIVELLLSVEPRLAYVKDVRGHRPFQYARREHWPNWREFIDRKRELILLPRSNSDGVLRERVCSSPI